jgi:hypothetical protein
MSFAKSKGDLGFRDFQKGDTSLMVIYSLQDVRKILQRFDRQSSVVERFSRRVLSGELVMGRILLSGMISGSQGSRT